MGDISDWKLVSSSPPGPGPQQVELGLEEVKGMAEPGVREQSDFQALWEESCNPLCSCVWFKGLMRLLTRTYLHHTITHYRPENNFAVPLVLGR